MNQPHLSGIAQSLAAQGRNGDDTLVHVSKKELAGLESLAKSAFGRELPRNPRTGLKEASLFQDWFGQDVGTALGVIAPIALGFIPGIGIPMAMAAGAALGAANQGLGKGGTTESALLGGVMGGMGAYGGTGIAEGIAGAATAAPEIALDASASTASTTLPGATGSFGASGNAVVGGTGGVGTDIAANTGGTALEQVTQALPNSSPLLNQINATNMAANAPLAEGMTPAAGKVVGGEFIPNQLPQSVPMTAGEKMASGWSNITKSPEAFGTFAKQNLGNIGTAAFGGMGAGMQMNPQEQTISTEPEKGSTANPYTAEWYIDPATGQRRTRAVKTAARGGAIYGDYDGVEEAQAGDGYMTGGTTYMAKGGSAGLFKKLDSVRRMATGGAASSAPPALTVSDKNPPNTVYRNKAFDVYAERIPTPLTAGNQARVMPNVLAKGFFTKEDYANATPEERAGLDALMAAKQEMVPSPMRRQNFAGGGGISGIGDLGGYSDGGRLLRGPGDGVSDTIPASIEGKRPARLADGEFVIPARAVSELGNGSTEAGSKQLYKMLDRIAAKRKKGKGLAYEANPQKLMPA